jgi:hypothetical protein
MGKPLGGHERSPVDDTEKIVHDSLQLSRAINRQTKLDEFALTHRHSAAKLRTVRVLLSGCTYAIPREGVAHQQTLLKAKMHVTRQNLVSLDTISCHSNHSGTSRAQPKIRSGDQTTSICEGRTIRQQKHAWVIGTPQAHPTRSTAPAIRRSIFTPSSATNPNSLRNVTVENAGGQRFPVSYSLIDEIAAPPGGQIYSRSKQKFVKMEKTALV